MTRDQIDAYVDWVLSFKKVDRTLRVAGWPFPVMSLGGGFASTPCIPSPELQYRADFQQHDNDNWIKPVDKRP